MVSRPVSRVETCYSGLLTQHIALDLLADGQVAKIFARLEGKRLIAILVQARSIDKCERKGALQSRVVGAGQNQGVTAQDGLDAGEEVLCHGDDSQDQMTTEARE